MIRSGLHKAAILGLALCGAVPAMAQSADTAPYEVTANSSAPTWQADASAFAPIWSLRPAPRPRTVVTEELPDLRWDHVRGSARWTRAAMRAIESHGQKLVDTVPRDIQAWCPAYPEADRWSRKAFWAGLLSTLAKHESTWRPNAVGGGGLWYGLVQIYPPTAQLYKCQARTGEALKDGALNMSCAVRIMNRTVPRDNVVARGMKGVAADWGPFHSTRKREDMRRWISRQPFCMGLHASARPVARPDWIGTPAGEAQDVPMFVAWELDKQFYSPGAMETPISEGSDVPRGG
ncbi:transglycosylase SLT domain-containing protein [Jannaschia aquimarina]|nr:transglycosylase SLT domain-containing protein [Jannaschia aquimarina]